MKLIFTGIIVLLAACQQEVKETPRRYYSYYKPRATAPKKAQLHEKKKSGIKERVLGSETNTSLDVPLGLASMAAYNSPRGNSASRSINPSKIEVQGYTKQNGTYVSPHIRTEANGTTDDNISR